MHVCALVYAGTLSHACVYGEQKTCMYVSFTIYFMLSEIEGSLDLKRLSGWRAPRSTFGVTDVRTTPSFSVGPGDLNLEVSCSYSKHSTNWSISTQPIICFEIRSHCSSEWPGTHCPAHSDLKLMTILLSQPSGMASASDTQL